ncbi:MAG: UDP-glucose/iron transport system ATP-binding protein [Blastocatellia bacterium]|jgi:ABC-type methionine transport system ATPase subunit|nr:UDP-glucose/iron transport system ATP-binding protein [Blastocatellia bacterium]
MSSIFVLKGVRQVKEGNAVLDGIELEINEGEITALIGPSGAGKTSLIRLLNRLDDPVGGQVLYRARPVNEYPVRELRRQVGFVFQTPVMFPGTVRDNLHEALKLAENNSADLEERVREVMALAELEAALAERDGERLSVGQKQRVNIARALMTSPEVLLMDEPTSALDPETADRLMETVHRLGREKGLTVVMITHRLSEARRASDATVLMERGRIVEAGPTAHLFEQTANERLRAFLDSEK